MDNTLFSRIARDGIVQVGPQQRWCKCGRPYISLLTDTVTIEGEDISDHPGWSKNKESAMERISTYINANAHAPVHRILPQIYAMGENGNIAPEESLEFHLKNKPCKWAVRARLCWCGDED